MDPAFPDPPEGGSERFDTGFAAALGRAIKVFRTGLGLGRRGLAQAAGLSYSYVTEIENGKKQASAGAQKAIAAALGMSVSELLAAAEQWAVQLEGNTDVVHELRSMPILKGAHTTSPLSRPMAAPDFVAESGHPEDGARRRQLRWFQSAARQVHASRHAAALAAPEPESAEEDVDLRAALARLRALLARMEPLDRQRVLDLAQRLARK